MSWGAVAGAAVGVVGGALSKKQGGGAGSSTQMQSKDPWTQAEPWLTENIGIGRAMQRDMMATPFSAGQQNAYNNQYALSDYARQIAPGLLSQMSAQPLGYDPSNPSARVKAFDFQPSLLNFSNVNGAGSPTTVDTSTLLGRGQSLADFDYQQRIKALGGG